jgi:hypothetical protein
MQDFATCADPVVLDAVRAAFGRFWDRAEEISGLDPLPVKTFMAFGCCSTSWPRWTPAACPPAGPSTPPSPSPQPCTKESRDRFEWL